VAVAVVTVATATETATVIVMALVTATTLMLMPSALPWKQFLFSRLLSLSRLLIYSSSCCAFRHPLSSHRLPVSMKALPLLSLLQCLDASHCKMLTLTLVLNVGRANA
jgi:hypothetical protein